jgi:hypothetical protein
MQMQFVSLCYFYLKKDNHCGHFMSLIIISKPLHLHYSILTK